MLLLGAQVRPDFSFYPPSVRRSVGWLVGRLLGWFAAGSVIGLFVRGLRAPNESGPVIIRSCYLP